MRVSLKSVPGVDSVNVSLENGLAVVKMKPRNATTLKQLNEAITKNGFTMKDSTAIIAGTVVSTDGKVTLRVSGSNDLLQLSPKSATAGDVTQFAGRSVLVQGTIPEGSKSKRVDTILYQSLTEENSQ